MTSSTDTAQRLIESERIAVRAVLVPQGEDPKPYLLMHGIVEPVAVPFAMDGESGAARSMGDGWTRSVTATVTFDTQEAGDASSSVAQPARALAAEAASEAAQTRTVTLPEAFGMRPLAPVRRPAER